MNSSRVSFRILRFFIQKCRHDNNKLKFNRNTKFSNLSSEECSAQKSPKKSKDKVIKEADLLGKQKFPATTP